jgi:hypothetical protein
LTTGRYAIVDTAEYDFLYKAAFDRFFEQLDSARAQADRDGWVSEDALKKHFGITTDA